MVMKVIVKLAGLYSVSRDSASVDRKSVEIDIVEMESRKAQSKALAYLTPECNVIPNILSQHKKTD